MIAPFVPGSFTYSSFGAGVAIACGFPDWRLDDSLTDEMIEGSSNRLEWKAEVKMRGMNRWCEIDEAETGSGLGGTEAESTFSCE